MYQYLNSNFIISARYNSKTSQNVGFYIFISKCYYRLPHSIQISKIFSSNDNLAQ